MGTSCKDLSNQNSSKHKKTVFNDSNSPGGSADTWRAFLAWLDSTNASWFVWENVDLAKGADVEAALMGGCCAGAMRGRRDESYGW